MDLVRKLQPLQPVAGKAKKLLVYIRSCPEEAQAGLLHYTRNVFLRPSECMRLAALFQYTAKPLILVTSPESPFHRNVQWNAQCIEQNSTSTD